MRTAADSFAQGVIRMLRDASWSRDADAQRPKLEPPIPDTPWDCHICLHWGGLKVQCRHIWQSHGVSGNYVKRSFSLFIGPAKWDEMENGK